MSQLTRTQQFKTGKDVERFLDEYFARYGYQIEPTTPHEERVRCLGDRHFRKAGLHWTVEYKSGLQTHFTGNVLLETLSVDNANKPGWVYTSQASVILYAALLDHKILVLFPWKLRNAIEYLKTKFPEVPTSNHQNIGYNTHGVLVPLHYVERYLADKTIKIDGMASSSS